MRPSPFQMFWTRVFTGVTALLICASPAWSQGMMPKTSTAPVDTSELAPLKIGEHVPTGLSVTAENAVPRTLLSYKSAIELLVVVFLAEDCENPAGSWHTLKQFYDSYQEWRVSFLAINVGAPDRAAPLGERLKKAQMPMAVAQSAPQAVRLFSISRSPMMLIIDESGFLRYRGPLGKESRKAIEAVIGHMEPVQNPEPPAPEGCPIR